MRFIALSSSSGTTFQAILDSLVEGSLQAQCLGLITDREDRGCTEKARKAGITVKVVERQKGEDREDYDKRLNESCIELAGEDPKVLIAAVGWMWILSPWFISQWKNRILNVHPALLPKHPGAHAITDSLVAGDTETGMTIHLIDEGVDTGPIILQKSCPVLPEDTEDTLKDRIQTLEKEWYPKMLNMIETGEIELPK
jgi:formyltetrahydrofolate-dependent phosphoribosylglycinamide formyltransferase